MRSLGVVPLAVVGTAALGVAPALTPGLVPGPAAAKTVVAEAALLDTESWIMGGSGTPIPPPSYLEAVSDRFIDPASPLFTGQPLFPVEAPNPLFTPEGLYPLTGVKTLELNPSLAQGVSILNSTITNQIAAGNSLVVLGYSQSATINSLEMKNLLDLPTDQQPTGDELKFVLLGDPSNPDGGLLSRFDLQSLNPSMPQLTIPSVGLTFSGATPADTPWDTAIYTQEYDGFADFPKYPINLLSDINAFLGIMFVHGTYPSLTDTQMASAFELPVSADYTGDLANTQYFMIPTATLPLLQPLQSIPLIGQPLYDLLEPDMRILVNLGYGSIYDGWDQGPANLPTPFGLFPDVNLGDLVTALGQGGQAGIDEFISDLSHLSVPSVADGISNSMAGGLPSLTDIVNTLTGAAATGYATLLPTADIITALLTTLPAYNVSIFLNELTDGNFLDAVGLPIAADTAVVTMAAGFEFEVLLNAAESISADFQGLIP